MAGNFTPDSIGHLADLFYRNAQAAPQQTALRYKRNGQWLSHTWQECWTHALKFSRLLHNIGNQPNVKIAIWSPNRPEWVFADVAIMAAGSATVPIYVTLAAEEIRYILSNCAARILVVENAELLLRLDPLLHELDQLWGIIVLEGKCTLKNPKAHQKLFFWEAESAALEPTEEAPVLKHIQSNRREETATIIYTSGTTGFPKGVILTHGNFLENARLVYENMPIRGNDTHLSFLPLSHVFERLCGYYLMVLARGVIAYAESIDTVVDNAKDIHPTFLIGVPRFYEKVSLRIKDRMAQATGLKKKLAGWAMHVGQKTAAGKAGALERLLAEKLVFKKIKASFGGKVRFGISGGAPLSKEIAEFFYGMNLLLLEGYGLTETSPVIACNRPDKHRFGTVGIPLPEIEVHISEEGEILTRSACVMKGYYHNAEATAQALKDGWFHTGDMGKIDEDGFLHITGRIKEIIVLSGGKKLCPTHVESQFEKQKSIERCVLFGEGKSFLTALIVPDVKYLETLAGEKDQHFKNKNELIHSAWAQEIVKADVDATHQNLARFEQIKGFKLLEEDFSIQNGELTPTLKVKRNVVYKKYGALLEPFYQPKN